MTHEPDCSWHAGETESGQVAEKGGKQELGEGEVMEPSFALWQEEEGGGNTTQQGQPGQLLADEAKVQQHTPPEFWRQWQQGRRQQQVQLLPGALLDANAPYLWGVQHIGLSSNAEQECAHAFAGARALGLSHMEPTSARLSSLAQHQRSPSLVPVAGDCQGYGLPVSPGITGSSKLVRRRGTWTSSGSASPNVSVDGEVGVRPLEVGFQVTSQLSLPRHSRRLRRGSRVTDLEPESVSPSASCLRRGGSSNGGQAMRRMLTTRSAEKPPEVQLRRKTLGRIDLASTSLEDKLELLAVQREANAVRCMAFLESLQQTQSTGAGPQTQALPTSQAVMQNPGCQAAETAQGVTVATPQPLQPHLLQSSIMQNSAHAHPSSLSCPQSQLQALLSPGAQSSPFQFQGPTLHNRRKAGAMLSLGELPAVTTPMGQSPSSLLYNKSPQRLVTQPWNFPLTPCSDERSQLDWSMQATQSASSVTGFMAYQQTRVNKLSDFSSVFDDISYYHAGIRMPAETMLEASEQWGNSASSCFEVWSEDKCT